MVGHRKLQAKRKALIDSVKRNYPHYDFEIIFDRRNMIRSKACEFDVDAIPGFYGKFSFKLLDNLFSIKKKQT